MRLLWLVGWPYFRQHLLRSLFTVAGIALGVAVFVGMNAANRSMLSEFSQTVDRVAGRTELQVSAGEAGFAEELLERVQAVPGVGVAVPVIEAVATTRLAGEGSLLILGVDFTGDRSLRDYDFDSGEEAVVDDPLVFLAQPDSIIVSTTFAQKNQLKVGSKLALGTAAGERQFTVRGIMKAGGLTSAFGGNLAVMDIYAAQKMFGRGRSFDRIDLASAPGHTVAQTQAAVEQALGPGYQVETPGTRSQHFEAVISAYSTMVQASSLFAMVIGMFIIYNAFAIAVAERRYEVGILRALGATRGQIQGLFLVESLAAGIVGSALGVAAGVFIARATAASMASVVGKASGIAQSQGAVAIEPGFLLFALGVGVLTSLAAAFVPARAAARTDPAVTLRKGLQQVTSERENRVRLVAAAVLAAVAAACLAVGDSRVLFYASYVLVIVVSVLLAPVLCLQGARLLRPVLSALRPVEGALAADSLVQSPRRTSACVVALMLSLALVIAFSGMARASFDSIADWAHTVLNSDAFVLPSPAVTARSIRFPESMAPELAAMPGVRQVQMTRQARITFQGAPVVLRAVEFSKMSATSGLKVADGDEHEMFQAAASGRALLVSENLAATHHLKRGDVIELPTPDGTLRLPIAGINVDYADQQGVISIDRSVYKQHWRDDTVNMFRLYFEPGVAFDEVKSRIQQRWSGERQVFVLANRDMQSYILGVANQWFSLTYVQIAVAVLVAVLGIVNTLTVSITDRRRELGVLRAVGALARQVRRTIWLEAIGIAVLGLALGGVLGAVNQFFVLRIVRHDVVGWSFPYQFPFPTLAMLVPLMIAVAFVAAVGPARMAMRGSLVEALAYE